MSRSTEHWRREAAGCSHRAFAAVIVGAGLFVIDGLWQVAGGSLLVAGPLDELAHLLTLLLVLWVLGPRVCEQVLVPAAIAAVGIDLDHVPQYLGSGWLTTGTPRPYSHSLLSVGVALIVGAVWKRRRAVGLGAALGLVVHFWRDMAEPGTGVSLLWPFSYHAFRLQHTGYLIAVVALIAGNSLWSPVIAPLLVSEARHS